MKSKIIIISALSIALVGCGGATRPKTYQQVGSHEELDNYNIRTKSDDDRYNIRANDDRYNIRADSDKDKSTDPNSTKSDRTKTDRDTSDDSTDETNSDKTIKKPAQNTDKTTSYESIRTGSTDTDTDSSSDTTKTKKTPDTDKTTSYESIRTGSTDTDTDSSTDSSKPKKPLPDSKDTSYDPTITGPTTSSTKANMSGDTDADNTRVNQRDSDLNTLTPEKTSENQNDLNLAINIRKTLVNDSALSTNAKNVKVISINGVITLRGVVNSSEEKSLIESKVKGISGVKRVDNQIDVKNTSNNV